MSIIKLNDRAVSNATTFGSISSLGEMVFISKATASSSASIEFTSGIDSTYKEYVFYFVNIDGGFDGVNDDDYFNFNLSTDSGSNYNVVKTTTFFNSFHYEDDSASGLSYNTNGDLAQSSNKQQIARLMTVSASDACLVGYLHLFNPSSTTYVKHFIGHFQYMGANAGRTHETFISGYANTTSNINAIKFDFNVSTIASGDILLFGIN